MPRPQSALLLAVVATILLAGCMGLGGDGGTTTSTATTTGTGAQTTGTGGGGPTATTTPAPSAAEIQTAAVAAMADVDTYRINGTIAQQFRGRINQTVTINTSAWIDRAARELRTRQVQTSDERTTTIRTFVVNRSIYSKSPSYKQQYKTAWILRKPTNFSKSWRALDTIDRQRQILKAANATLLGTESVQGTSAYVLELEMSSSRYKQIATNLLGPSSNLNESQLTIREVSFVYWIATDTNRPVRTVGRINLTVQSRGNTIQIDQRLRIDYREYGLPIDVSLPPKARKNAKNVSAAR